MGSSNGGRWSPNGGFEALYACLDRDGAMAEAYSHLSRAPVISSSHMLLNTLEISVSRVLHLSQEFFQRASIDDYLAHSPDLRRTQAVGSAAHLVGAEAIVVPSARWECENVMIFLDQIDLNSQLSLVVSEDINWPAWRERHKIAAKG